MPTNNGDFYQQLQREIQEWLETRAGQSSKWGKHLLLAPDLFHLLCKLAIDKAVPDKEKARIAVGIAYFVSPIDLLPEGYVGPSGYIDDVVLGAYVLHGLIDAAGAEVVQAQWAGERSIAEIVDELIQLAPDMVGESLWARLKHLVD